MSTHSEAMSFTGTLSDGRSADAMRVDVRFSSKGLELRHPQSALLWVWPYEQLHCSVPLSAKAADVLLSRRPDGGQTLFVAEPGFARQLLGCAPALSAARQRLRGSRPGLAVVGTVLAVALGTWFFELQPAQAVARVLPPPARQALGQNFVASLLREHKVCETAASRAALDRLTGRLAAAASSRPMEVRVTLLDWRLVNAFALPGGQIVLTRGLVQAAGSADEVAGALAHELGHALELHPETGLVRAMGLAAAAQLMFAGSAGTVSNIGLVLTQLRYTRIAEREADMHALRMLKGAGISHKGFGDFFERLDRLEGGRPAAQNGKRITDYEVIRTHPVTAERIAMVRAQPAYPATPALSEDDWRALRGACGPAAAPVSPAAPSAPAPANPDADREIAEATKTLETNPQDVAALHKRAQAYSRKRQNELAIADLNKAIELKPDDAALHFGRAWSRQNERQYEEALRDYDVAIRLAPDHVGARNGRGNTYRALKRHDAALADFDHLVRFNPKLVSAYYNRALVLVDLNQADDAVRDLSAAIRLDKDYAAAYAQRGLLHEKAGARDQAIADFRAALAAPAKFESAAWAHRTARDRLNALGVQVP
jgi:predicted Zn-dependent protease